MKRAITFAFILFGCGPAKEKEQASDSTAVRNSKDGQTVRSYYDDGKTKSEVIYKNGRKNGMARTYTEDGSLVLELPYVNDKREGISKKYYTGGTVLAQTTEYKNDKMNGMQTKYRGNGKIMSEARYDNDLPCADLKEYLENGSLKKKYPTIEIKVQDNVAATGTYKLKVSLSERVRSVKFYRGQLPNSGCLTDDLYFLLIDPATKVGEIPYDVPPGESIKGDINIIAAFETLMGNTAIVQRKYHIAVSN